MKVEIWSDIMCPFCYIGKRNFEKAMSEFPDAKQIEIEWHSFQLDPTIPRAQGKKQNVYQYLAEMKGISYERSERMHDALVQTAKNAGLDYHFEKAIVANSYDAHKMIQLAKTNGLGDEAEERLFHAYFTEGKDFGDFSTLIGLGKDIGLKEDDIRNALNGEDFAMKVDADIQEAEDLGIQSVPFFVFNRKYALPGAQPVEQFKQVLIESYKEWKSENP